ncbi:GNAT family N-acetyltransferase [Larkinella sp. VNQ87]|uniref:GNAT family N-acetyltransferase n=1 Tax=Larkinella sp. VNQ87 TaxID=3400921 RepID=UPI003C0C3A5E
MATLTLAQSDADLQGILALQRQNLRTVLTTDILNSQGFLTIEHDLPLLRRMNDAAPSIIAKDGAEVVGYSLTMLPSFRDDIPMLTAMFDLLDNLTYQNRLLGDYAYVVMGQICVAKRFRGQGLFDGLYGKFREELAGTYALAVTEVAVRNRRSQRAHERVGFRKLHTYFDPSNGEDWDVVVWDWGEQ